MTNEHGYTAVLVCVAATFIIYAALCIPFDYAPVRDLSEWIFQSQVFNRLLAGDPSDVFFVKEYPVPYATSQLTISLLLYFFSPFVVSKLLLAVFFALALCVIVYFVRRNGITPSASLFLLITVVFNSCFWNGYIGYEIGLVLFCLYIALQESAKTNACVVLFFSILLFFTHGVIYAAFGLIAVVYGVYDRRIKIVIASLGPSASLAALYLFYNSQQPHNQPVLDNQLVINNPLSFIEYKAYTLAKLGGYQNLIFNYSGDHDILRFLPTVGLVVNMVYGLLLVTIILIGVRVAFRKNHFLSAEIVAGCILLFGFMVSPKWALGLLNPGERLLYPALILLTPALFRPAIGRFLIPVILVALPLTIVSAMSLSAKSSVIAQVSTTASNTNEYEGHILFGHRLDTFDSKMRETQRAWLAKEIPDARLYFDTSLILER